MTQCIQQYSVNCIALHKTDRIVTVWFLLRITKQEQNSPKNLENTNTLQDTPQENKYQTKCDFKLSGPEDTQLLKMMGPSSLCNWERKLFFSKRLDFSESKQNVSE